MLLCSSSSNINNPKSLVQAHRWWVPFSKYRLLILIWLFFRLNLLYILISNLSSFVFFISMSPFLYPAHILPLLSDWIPLMFVIFSLWDVWVGITERGCWKLFFCSNIYILSVVEIHILPSLSSVIELAVCGKVTGIGLFCFSLI